MIDFLEATLGLAFLLFAVIVIIVIPIWKWANRRHIVKRMLYRAKALPKQALSYRKSKWVFKDYPVDVYKLKSVDPKYAYGARILYWPAMTQLGAIPAEAIEELKKKFEAYVKEKDKLPRPGSTVPLNIVSMENISQYMDVFSDFYDKVLHRYVGWPLITDLSCLCHFGQSDEVKFKEEIIRYTKEAYGVDITDYYEEPIYKVMAVLQEKADISK
jgi:hypothetical protein